MHRRINLWSGPRNISTALMYSFAQRHDTKVFDEPLYAHYLKTTGIIHPGTADILRSQENDGEKVVASLILGYNEKPVLFFKQMTHHLIDLDMEFLEKTYNILLIRDPKNVLNSYRKVIEKPTLEDIGIKQSFELFSFLESKGYHYFIIDSAQILKDPETALTKFVQLVIFNLTMPCYDGKRVLARKMEYGLNTGIQMYITQLVFRLIRKKQ